MPATEPVPTCATCQWFFDDQCFRYPPTVILIEVRSIAPGGGYPGRNVETEAVRPSVTENDFCGEHAERRP